MHFLYRDHCVHLVKRHTCMMGTAGDTLNPSRNMGCGGSVLGTGSSSSSAPAACTCACRAWCSSSPNVEMGKTDIPFSFVVENTSELVSSSSSSSLKNCGLSV